MQTFNFRITEDQLKKLNSDIVKFNKLADKLGCGHASLITNEAVLATDPHHKVNTITDVSWHLPQIKFFDCVLSSETVIAGDYSFVGAIEYYKTQDEVTFVKLTNKHIPTEYENSLPTCDHCNTKRKRNTTFVLQSNVDGSTVQVGSTCLKDFFGYNASDLLRALKWMIKFTNVTGNYLYTPMTTTVGAFHDKQKRQYGVREILMLTNAVIRIFGYHTAKSGTHVPTSQVVAKMCEDPESKEGEYWLKKVNENRLDMTDSTMANEVVKWANADTRTNDYMYSVRSCINSGTITSFRFGILCSAVGSFRAAMQRKIEVSSQYNDVFIGTVGVRQEFEVKCIDTKVMDSYYGSTVLYTMVDTDNHVLTWFSTSDLEIPKDSFLKIKGTVKKHQVYNDVHQTMLTRVAKVK